MRASGLLPAELGDRERFRRSTPSTGFARAIDSWREASEGGGEAALRACYPFEDDPVERRGAVSGTSPTVTSTSTFCFLRSTPRDTTFPTGVSATRRWTWR